MENTHLTKEEVVLKISNILNNSGAALELRKMIENEINSDLDSDTLLDNIEINLTEEIQEALTELEE